MYEITAANTIVPGPLSLEVMIKQGKLEQIHSFAQEVLGLTPMQSGWPYEMYSAGAQGVVFHEPLGDQEYSFSDAVKLQLMVTSIHDVNQLVHVWFANNHFNRTQYSMKNAPEEDAAYLTAPEFIGCTIRFVLVDQ